MALKKSKKSARLEARLTPKVYALVHRAATLQGRSVSDFVVTAAQRAAEEAIGERTMIELSRADQERFAAALLGRAPLASALARAANAHRELVQRS